MKAAASLLLTLSLLSFAACDSFAACSDEDPAPTRSSGDSDEPPASPDGPSIEIHAPAPPTVTVEAN